MDSKPGFVLTLFSNFFPKVKAFVYMKVFLQQKRVYHAKNILKAKTEINEKAYNKHQNCCVSLIRPEERLFFRNIMELYNSIEISISAML